MILSEEQKKQLEQHYNNNEVYDPSRDPKQTPVHFAPKLCQGGAIGYDDGGEVDPLNMPGVGPQVSDMGDMSAMEGTPKGIVPPPAPAPKQSSWLDTLSELAPGKLMADATGLRQPGVNVAPATTAQAQEAPSAPTSLPQAQPAAPTQAPAPQNAPSASSPAAGGKLAPDELAQLIQHLQHPGVASQVLGGVGNGLRGFGDAIMQGVARAGPGQSQKNANEATAAHNQELIDALRAKYENQFKGKELAVRQGELERQTQQNAAQNALKSKELGQAATKEGREASQATREQDLKTIQEYSPFKPGGVTRAEYDAAQARIKGTAPTPGGKVSKTASGHSYTVTP